LNLPNNSAGITMGGRATIFQRALTTSATTANQQLATLPYSNHNIKYQVSIVSGSDYHSADITLTNDTITSYITVANEMWTNVSLTDWNTDINGTNVRLLVTPTNAVTTYRAFITQVI